MIQIKHSWWKSQATRREGERQRGTLNMSAVCFFFSSLSQRRGLCKWFIAFLHHGGTKEGRRGAFMRLAQSKLRLRVISPCRGHQQSARRRTQRTRCGGRFTSSSRIRENSNRRGGVERFQRKLGESARQEQNGSCHHYLKCMEAEQVTDMSHVWLSSVMLAPAHWLAVQVGLFWQCCLQGHTGGLKRKP